MKKILNLLLATLVSLPMMADGKLSLRNVMDGTFYPERYYSIVPMNDGEHFARMSNDRKMVLQCSFKSGEVVDTLFDASTARGFDNKNIDDYAFSPDESRMLIQTNTASIYRRSFTAEHYIYSRKNNKVEPLSQNGAQQVPKFSPDGTMIAFVRDNNLFIVKLLFENS